MKFRVKFKCYWYNTGAADNKYYINTEDFDTLEEAEAFRKRVDTQYDIYNRRVVSEHSTPPSEYELKYNRTITYQEVRDWEKSEDFIDIENGTIEGKATIVKYHPESEETL